jgi:hypothetical protein
MSTNVTAWNGVELGEMGAVYPFLGSEVMLTIICAALVVGWFIWQWQFESSIHKKGLEKLRDPEKLARAMRYKTLHKDVALPKLKGVEHDNYVPTGVVELL